MITSLLSMYTPRTLKVAGLVAAVFLVFSTGVSVYSYKLGRDRCQAAQVRQVVKEVRKVNKANAQRVAEVVTEQKKGQRKAARIDELRRKVDEAKPANDAADCSMSADELRAFNELAGVVGE